MPFGYATREYQNLPSSPGQSRFQNKQRVFITATGPASVASGGEVAFSSGAATLAAHCVDWTLSSLDGIVSEVVDVGGHTYAVQYDRTNNKLKVVYDGSVASSGDHSLITFRFWVEGTRNAT